jgi:hypothetical protein
MIQTSTSVITVLPPATNKNLKASEKLHGLGRGAIGTSGIPGPGWFWFLHYSQAFLKEPQQDEGYTMGPAAVNGATQIFVSHKSLQTRRKVPHPHGLQWVFWDRVVQDLH